MSFGPLLFGFAVVPVLIFIRCLQNVRHCLDSPRAQRRVFFEMPIILLLAPIAITILMSVEASVDPDFMRRSFTNPEGRETFDFFLYSLDQSLRGAFFDIMETFQVSVSPLIHKCDSVLFCSSMLLYRTSVGIAGSTFIFAGVMIVRSWFRRTD